MAGHHTNWYRPRSGPYRGTAVYVSKADRQLLAGKRKRYITHGEFLNRMEQGDGAVSMIVARSKAPTATAKPHFYDHAKAGTDPKALVDKTQAIRFEKDMDLTGMSLHGIPFTPVKKDAWKKHKDKDLGEPDYPSDRPQRPASGVVVLEDDGRMWIMEPTWHYGQQEHGFATGGVEEGLTAQQSARKEAIEELGFDVEITDWLGDVDTWPRSYRRYYIARRKSGQPTDAHYESDNVKLIPPGDMDTYFNKDYDKAAAALLKDYLAKKPKRPTYTMVPKTQVALPKYYAEQKAKAEAKEKAKEEAKKKRAAAKAAGGSSGSVASEKPARTGRKPASKGPPIPGPIAKLSVSELQQQVKATATELNKLNASLKNTRDRGKAKKIKSDITQARYELDLFKRAIAEKNAPKGA
jgi:8-oxo-dGTP pyrophosphatase MutT (NUDIX family)